MCGIAGVVAGRDRDSSYISAMTGSLRHRGPDDLGVWRSADKRVALGHRRLSIIDLSPLGRNPMRLEGTGLWITYNGEVYNFRDIRRDLESHGYRFRSQTDTEVVMAAYSRWGVRCLDRFVGMFAFGIWDETRKRLFLARDRLGKKPLYYASYAGRFAFASELKALLADREFPRDIDPDAVSLYLRYGYVPAPYSIFRAARKLPGGHFAVLEDGALKVERYWDPVEVALSQPFPGDVEEAETELHKILTDSVAGRMISDVPLGAFLSGGIDSSLVVALMQEQATRPVKTFTIRFNEPRFNEADHAAAVARHLGTEHHEEVCDVSQMLDILDVLPDYFDEPFADASAIPTYLVSKATRKHVTVALSGDGGDELFFGYWRYHSYAATRRWLEAPRPVRRTLAAIASRLPDARFHRAAQALRDDEPDRYAPWISHWSAWRGRAVHWPTGPSESGLLRHATSHRAAVARPAASHSRSSDLSSRGHSRQGGSGLDGGQSRGQGASARPPRGRVRSTPAPTDEVSAGPKQVAPSPHPLPQGAAPATRAAKDGLRRPESRLASRSPARSDERPRVVFGVTGTSVSTPTFVRAAWSDFLQREGPNVDMIWNLFALALWSSRWRSVAAAKLEISSSVEQTSNA